MELVRAIRQKMMVERLMFAYRGVVTNENSLPLLMLLEKEMEISEFAFLGRKRLFMFVLENLQNVTRHGENNQHADMSLVVYSKTSDGYTITTGNVIPSVHVDDLRYQLRTLNSLDVKDIKAMHRQALTGSDFSEKGGAGLGLMEMAIKTGNRLDFDFIPVDDLFSYFILSKTVNSQGIGENKPGEDNPFSSSSTLQLEKLMKDRNIDVMWSGHLSGEIAKEVLAFAETSLKDDDVETDLRRRVFSILIELLENVAKYNPGKEAEAEFGLPVVMICSDENMYTITSGNLIAAGNVKNLRDKIEDINNSDRRGLVEMMADSLVHQNIHDDTTGNMGLLEMARKSRNKLQYLFEKVNDSYSYYVLEIMVRR